MSNVIPLILLNDEEKELVSKHRSMTAICSLRDRYLPQPSFHAARNAVIHYKRVNNIQ